MLKDPRWQKKRLEVMERDGWKCSNCGDKESQLQVHHRYYIYGRFPWEYPGFCFQTLCRECHEINHEDTEISRIQNTSVLEDWEVGLDYYGESIFFFFTQSVEASLNKQKVEQK